MRGDGLISGLMIGHVGVSSSGARLWGELFGSLANRPLRRCNVRSALCTRSLRVVIITPTDYRLGKKKSRMRLHARGDFSEFLRFLFFISDAYESATLLLRSIT